MAFSGKPNTAESNTRPDPHTAQAYRACTALARAHYENFPVASRLLPRRMRGAVAAIYVFARRADDHADEGMAPAAERLSALQRMEDDLAATCAGNPPDDPLWRALLDTLERFDLPVEPFLDLLTAFRQDVTHDRYADFDEILAYCQHSANPIGRLMLMLAGAATPENLRDSDAICTALQLLNFLQDLQQDFVERDRLYIPLHDLRRHGVDEEELRCGRASPAVRALLHEQAERAAWWLYEGSPLAGRLRGRFGVEVRLIVRGGWRIAQRLREEKPGDPLARPRLDGRDRRWIARGLFRRRALPKTVREPVAPVRTRTWSPPAAPREGAGESRHHD